MIPNAKGPLVKAPKIIRDLAALITTSRRETDLDKLNAALVEARQQIDSATSDLTAAEAGYRDGLLDASPAELDRLQAAQGRAKIDMDRAEALVDAITIRIASVREAEARAARKAIHDDAVAKCEAIRARLPIEYHSHAIALRHLIRDLAEAECARERAHSEAPDFPDIPSPEADLRTLYGLPEEIVERSEIRLWVVDGRTDPVPADRQSAVRRSAEHPSRGILYLTGSSNHSAPTSGVPLTCTERSFGRIRYRDAVQGFAQEALHRTVSLPGFGLNGPAFVTADPLRDYSGALVELASDLPPPVGRSERPIQERLELIPEPPATREQIVPNEKREPEPYRSASASQIRAANTPSIVAAAAERLAG